MDTLTKRERSRLMSKVLGRGNRSTEIRLAILFRRHKVTGWRRHFLIRTSSVKVAAAAKKIREEMRVRPDFVFPKHKLALFVDGCFWHGCPRHATQPKGNAAFWRNKLSRNKARDRRVNRTLRSAKWRVVRIWECSLRRRPEACIRRIQRALV